MNAYRAKIRIATACRGVTGGVKEIPPDGPDEDDEESRFIRIHGAFDQRTGRRFFRPET